MKTFNKYIFLVFATTLLVACVKESSDINFDSGSNVGLGGSTARFTVAKNHLYTLDEFKLKVFSLNNPTQPTFVSEFGGEGLETIFPYKDFLFIGSETGMYTFSILNPSQPQLISTYIHIRSCDPVVVNDTTAFVTLRADNNCRIGGGANQLEVINIKNKSTPILVNTVPLIAPKGLGLVGSRLFVCDTNGLLLFDVSDWNNIELVKIYSGFIGNDVIPMGDIMLLTSDSGIFILNIENTEDVKQIAKIQ